MALVFRDPFHPHGAAEIDPVGKERKQEQIAEESSPLPLVASRASLLGDWNPQVAPELLGELWFGAKSVV